uniref:Uncharacterized protein n=1 Tax=viral metagenome TaxID=1070528 RepID=A0A6H2A1M3_9ZZZZ
MLNNYIKIDATIIPLNEDGTIDTFNGMRTVSWVHRFTDSEQIVKDFTDVLEKKIESITDNRG